MDMDERWVSRSPRTMLETFHWFRGEGFGLIVEDLLDMGPGVIAEGFRLLPRLVRPLLADPGHAVWLLPTPGFRRAAFENRGPPHQFWQRASDPERALRNLPVTGLPRAPRTFCTTVTSTPKPESMSGTLYLLFRVEGSTHLILARVRGR
jgi:hypothetical protein